MLGPHTPHRPPPYPAARPEKPEYPDLHAKARDLFRVSGVITTETRNNKKVYLKVGLDIMTLFALRATR
jgi:hypothetical protein